MTPYYVNYIILGILDLTKNLLRYKILRIDIIVVRIFLENDNRFELRDILKNYLLVWLLSKLQCREIYCESTPKSSCFSQKLYVHKS